MKPTTTTTITALALCATTVVGSAAVLAPAADAATASATRALGAASATNGTGWIAAIRHAKSADDNTGTLVMISPAGTRSTIGKVSDNARIDDVSADGRYVITSLSTAQGQVRATVWDTTTRKASYFRPAGGATNTQGGRIAFTTTGVIAQTEFDGKASQVETFNRSGVRLSSWPSAAATGRIAVSPDGGRVAQVVGSKALHRNPSGTLVHTSQLPAAVAKQNCAAANSYTATSFLVSCEGSGLGDDRSFELRADGSVSGQLVPNGAGEVWRSSLGVVTQGFSGGIAAPIELHQGKRTRTLPLGEGATVVGVRGSVVYTTDYSGGSSGQVRTYDIRTGATSTLAGTGSTGGGVIVDAYPVDGNR